MASLTIPSPDVAIGKMKCPHCGNDHDVRIADTWFPKLTAWLKRTNDVSAGGGLTVTATSNTNLRFSYIGSDGVTRVANLTLA